MGGELRRSNCIMCITWNQIGHFIETKVKHTYLKAMQTEAFLEEYNFLFICLTTLILVK